MKKLNLRSLIVCWGLLSILSMSAQEKLSVKAMHEDIDYYFNAIKEMHPHPYAKYTESQLDSVKLQLYKDCSHPMNLLDFNFLLAKTSKYTDGHTCVYPPQYNLTSDEKDNLFPPVKFKEGKILLNECVVQSINGIPSSKIVQELDGLVSWQMHPKKREDNMNYNLTALLYKVFHISTPFVCRIQNKETDGVVRDLIVKPVKIKDYSLHKELNKNYSAGALPYEYFPNDSIAVLFYNTSHILGNKPLEKAMDQFTKVFFEQIKQQKMKYLFIDVSQNGGGSDNAHKYFFRSLKTKPYKYTNYKMETLKGGLKRNEFYCLMETNCKTKEYLPINKHKELNNSNIRLEKTIKKLQKKGELKETCKFKGNETGFDGKVFIIMGNNTYSAAYDFCEQAKWHKAGLLVGEESGQYSPYAGNVCLDKLPNSGIDFGFATTYFWTVPDLPKRDGFLQPDIPYDLSMPLEMKDYKEIIRLSDELNSYR